MRIHFWNVAFSLFYLAILFLGLSWLFKTNRIFYDIPLRDLILITLAIFRLIRLFTYDIITKFVRDWFSDSAPNTFSHTVGTLLNCPWCIGLWFSYFVLFFYFATIYAWPVILILALAGVASFVQIVANLIGWSAQVKKQQSQAFDEK